MALTDCCLFETESIALLVTHFQTPLTYRDGHQDQRVVLDSPVEIAAVAELLKTQDASIDQDGLQRVMQPQE